MAYQKITTINDSAALLLPPDLLEQVGIAVGDEVELIVVDGTLILRSLVEVAREQKIAHITQSILERRKHVYAALAEGPTE